MVALVNFNHDLVAGEFQPRRLDTGGKHTTEKIETGSGGLVIRCVCGWTISSLGPFRDMAEEAAWVHISHPELAIAGSSDIERSGRLARAAWERNGHK